jgi:rubrerythrin
MTDEQIQTLKTLQLAIQMEIDGKEFYRKSSSESLNETGKKLFATLAEEEDLHRRKFEEIYQVISNKRAWPKIVFHPNKAQTIKTIFAKALEKVQKPSVSELEAIQTAIKMEIRSYDLYISQSKTSTSAVQRSFYEALAGEERGHHLALIDYQEYLTDPAGYFSTTEHHSLDGA